MGDHFHRGGYPPGPPRDFRRDGEGRYYGHHAPDHYGPSGGAYPPPHREEPIKQERDPFFDRRPVEPAPLLQNMALKTEFKQEEPDLGQRGPSAGGPPQSYQNRKRPFDDRGRGFYEHREDRRTRSPQGRGGGGSGGGDEDDVFDESFVVLDNYNSDLPFKLSKDRTVGFPLTTEGFAYLWSGARATHGVNKGRVCFEIRIKEEIAVGHLPASEPDPHVVRVGWSLDTCSTQLGEEMYSYGYGGTAKKSTNSKFENYGETFAENDVIGCFIDFETRGDIEISFSKNGRYLGTAFRISRGAVGNQALFPHVLVKNCCVEFNFGQKTEPFCTCPPGFTFIQEVPTLEKVRGTEPPKNKAECEILMMVGLPGAGKTTWAMKHSAANPGKKYNILGTNAIMEKMRVMGLRRQRNYAGRWDVLIQQATKCLNQLIQIAARRKRNYILDQTNVYGTAQRRKMRPFEGFHRKAVIICPTDEDLLDRIVKRTDEEGKDVPDHAVLEMKANFSLPEPGDFLEEVIYIELQKEEAETLIREYNEEGKKAGQPPEKKFRGRGGGGGGGVGRGEAARGGFDNRGPPVGGRGGFQGRGGYNRGGGPGGGGSFNRGGNNTQSRWSGNSQDNGSEHRGGYGPDGLAGSRGGGYGPDGQAGSRGGGYGSDGQAGSRGGGYGSDGQAGSRGGGYSPDGQAGRRGGGYPPDGQAGRRGGGYGSDGPAGSRGGGYGSDGQAGSRGGGYGSDGQAGSRGGGYGSDGQAGSRGGGGYGSDGQAGSRGGGYGSDGQASSRGGGYGSDGQASSRGSGYSGAASNPPSHSAPSSYGQGSSNFGQGGYSGAGGYSQSGSYGQAGGSGGSYSQGGGSTSGYSQGGGSTSGYSQAGGSGSGFSQGGTGGYNQGGGGGYSQGPGSSSGYSQGSGGYSQSGAGGGYSSSSQTYGAGAQSYSQGYTQPPPQSTTSSQPSYSQGGYGSQYQQPYGSQQWNQYQGQTPNPNPGEPQGQGQWSQWNYGAAGGGSSSYDQPARYGGAQ